MKIDLLKTDILSGACIGAAACVIAVASAAAQERGPDRAEITTVSGAVSPVNDGETTMQDPHGEVRIAPLGDRLEIAVYARGLEPGMHRTLIHGFAEERPREARCPTQDADINDDGWVDLAEARLVAGVALVPVTADTMAFDDDSTFFPEAGTWGVADFETRVPIDAFRTELAERHATPPALDTRVVLILGVSEETALPRTVYAPIGFTAHATVPVACAELNPEPLLPG